MSKIDIKPDWDRIELDYRAGIKTLRQIAVEHGISHAAVAKRARKDDWARDLSAKIQAKAEALVTKRSVTKLVTAEAKIAERQVVDANAEVVANVRLAHRKDIQRARALTMQMLDELEQQTDPETLELLRQLGEMMQDGSGMDRLSGLYHRVIGLPERTKTLKMLTESLRVTVDLERQAYGIKDGEGGIEDALKAILQRVTTGTGSSLRPVQEVDE